MSRQFASACEWTLHSWQCQRVGLTDKNIYLDGGIEVMPVDVLIGGKSGQKSFLT